MVTDTMPARSITSQGVSPARVCRTAAKAVLCSLLQAGLFYGASAAPAVSSSGPPVERQVKAAFLYNLARFVDWPEDSSSGSGGMVTIGVLEGGFAGVLDEAVRDKTVKGRGVAVRRFPEDGTVESCHILFVGAEHERRLPEILRRIAGRPILTVGDGDHFLRDGGIVRFLIENNRMRFEINVDAAERAGLKISSKLLSLARVVRDETATGLTDARR